MREGKDLTKAAYTARITVILKKILVNLIPIKNLRRYVCSRVLWNNEIIVIKNNTPRKLCFWQRIKGLKIDIDGKNNTIIVKFPVKLRKSKIKIEQSDNTVTRIEARKLSNVFIVYSKGHDSICEIKEETGIAGAYFRIGERNTGIVIGKDCMFSRDILIRSSDTHSILDKDTNEILNFPKDIVRIGNHCWIGQNAVINKNAKLPDNTIVGTFAVVTKPFTEEYTALAGNPAKVVKKNVAWDRQSIHEYKEKQF